MAEKGRGNPPFVLALVLYHSAVRKTTELKFEGGYACRTTIHIGQLEKK
jgi:hypothetical protein